MVRAAHFLHYAMKKNIARRIDNSQLGATVILQFVLAVSLRKRGAPLKNPEFFRIPIVTPLMFIGSVVIEEGGSFYCILERVNSLWIK